MFDGVPYADVNLCFPRLYHPHASHTGQAFAEPLRTAYAYALNHGRMVIDQNYAMPLRSPGNYRTTRHLSKTTFTRIAEGHRFIHDGVTHLVAEAYFACTGASDVGTAYHHVVIEDGGGNVDTGSTVESLVVPQLFNGTLRPGSAIAGSGVSAAIDAFSIYSWAGQQVARFEVKLDTVSAAAARRVYVEAYAVLTNGDATAYLPQHVAVWTEIR